MFALTSIPNPHLPSGLPRWSDKATHASLYAVFAWLMVRAQQRTGGRAIVFVTMVFIATVSAVDEWHQLFIPGRTADTVDWAADVVGGAAGCFLAWALARRELRS